MATGNYDIKYDSRYYSGVNKFGIGKLKYTEEDLTPENLLVGDTADKLRFLDFDDESINSILSRWDKSNYLISDQSQQDYITSQLAKKYGNGIAYNYLQYGNSELGNFSSYDELINNILAKGNNGEYDNSIKDAMSKLKNDYQKLSKDAISTNAGDVIKNTVESSYTGNDYGKYFTNAVAADYYQYLSNLLSSNYTPSTKERFKSAAKSIAGNIIGGVSYITEGLVDTIDNGKITLPSKYSTSATILNNAQKQQELSSQGFSDAGKFFWDTGISIVNNLVNMAISGGNGAITAALMGVQSGTQASNDIIQRGGTQAQAIGSGIFNGLLEAGMEYLPQKNLEKIVKNGIKGSKVSMMKGILAQSAAEFNEETLTEAGGIIVDLAIMKDNSEMVQYFNQYLQEHPNASNNTALWNCVGKALTQVLQAGAAGAISGGALATGGNIVGTTTKTINTLKTINNSSSKENKINLSTAYKITKLDDASDTSINIAKNLLEKSVKSNKPINSLELESNLKIINKTYGIDLKTKGFTSEDLAEIVSNAYDYKTQTLDGTTYTADEQQQALIKGLSNGNLSAKTMDTIDALKESTGLNVVFATMDSGITGVNINGNNIVINTNTEVNSETLIEHEYVHYINKKYPDMFKRLESVLNANMDSKIKIHNSKGKLETMSVKKALEMAGKTYDFSKTNKDVINEEKITRFIELVLNNRTSKVKSNSQFATLLGIENKSALKSLLQVSKSLGSFAKRLKKGGTELYNATTEITNEIEKLLKTPVKQAKKGNFDKTFTLNGVDQQRKESTESLGSALGIEVKSKKGVFDGFYKDGKKIDKFTIKDMENTPLNTILKESERRNIINHKQYLERIEFFADFMNMIINMNDPNAAFELVGTTMFSVVKSNSDAQYKWTIDYATICKKTESMMNAMSGAMKDRAMNPEKYFNKETGKYEIGLTKQEVVDLYDKEVLKGNLVPCPYCYVFSRWLGVGGILNNIYNYQKKYEKYTLEELEKAYDKASTLIKKRAAKTGEQEGTARASLISEYSNARTLIDFYENIELTDKEKWAKYGNKYKTIIKSQLDKVNVKSIQELNDTLDLLSECSWLKDVRMDKNYEPVRDDVLFDLNKGAVFAEEYPLTWKYRSNLGAGAGKAITPYADSRIGGFIEGILSPNKQFKGEWGTELLKKQVNLITRATKKQKRQNLVGGTRIQSYSDFKQSFLTDYLIDALQLELVGAKVQGYTKVIEAVDLFASLGYSMNMSIAGESNGVKDGKLVFSNLTGMNYESAVEMMQKYPQIGTILVGANNLQINLALNTKEIRMVIPYHKSGHDAKLMADMVRSLGEFIDEYVDYSDFSEDKIIKIEDFEKGYYRIKSTKYDLTPYKEYLKSIGEDFEYYSKVRTIRKNIIAGNKGKAIKFTDDEMKIINSNKYLKNVYNIFYNENSEYYHTFLPKDQAKRIFPYEFWDKNTTYDTSKINSKNFIEYCVSLGIVPRFCIFTDNDFYWKTIVDRNMYDYVTGKYVEQPIVSLDKLVTNREVAGMKDGKYVNLANKFEGKTQEYFAKDYAKNKEVKMSTEVDSDGNQLTIQQQEYFADSKVRDNDDNLLKVYTGTNAEFTVFDKNYIGKTGRFEGSGFNFTPSKSRAKSYGGKVLEGYVNVSNPISSNKKTMTINQLAKLIREIDQTGDNIISNYAVDSYDYGKQSFIDRESLNTAKLISKYNDNDADIYAELSLANPDSISIINKYKELGYDGLIHYGENNNIKTIITFDSNQFKNANNLNPTENDDIRYSIEKQEMESMVNDYIHNHEKELVNDLVNYEWENNREDYARFSEMFDIDENEISKLNKNEWVSKYKEYLKNNYLTDILVKWFGDEIEQKILTEEKEKYNTMLFDFDNDIKNKFEELNKKYNTELSLDIQKSHSWDYGMFRSNYYILKDKYGYELLKIRFGDGHNNGIGGNDYDIDYRKYNNRIKNEIFNDIESYMEDYQNTKHNDVRYSRDEIIYETYGIEKEYKGKKQSIILPNKLYYVGVDGKYEAGNTLYTSPSKAEFELMFVNNASIYSVDTSYLNLDGIELFNNYKEDFEYNPIFDKFKYYTNIKSTKENSISKFFAPKGSTTMSELETIFNKLNSNEDVKKLAQKVFKVAKEYDKLTAKFVYFDYRSKALGFIIGDSTRFNIEFFESLSNTDQKKAEVILHEVIHQVTAYALNNGEKGLSEREKQLYDTLEEVRLDLKKYEDTENMYGTKNVYELVAELSNPKFVEKLKKKNLIQRIIDAIKQFFGIKLNTAYDVVSNALDNILINNNPIMKNYYDSGIEKPPFFNESIKYSKETNSEILKELNDAETKKVYRSMQLIDGKLYPPMAAKMDGKLVDHLVINEWYRSDERPDLAVNKNGKKDENGGYFILDKGNGKKIIARYNPYYHTTSSPLNDQFSSAYLRPNLVVVEGEIPVSELTSEYKAEKAKDSVGEKKWHSGVVSSKLGKSGKPRTVILSRWFKANRIVDNSEVAQKILEVLDGENIAIPYNVVTPLLKNELEKLGVKISYEYEDSDIKYSTESDTSAKIQKALNNIAYDPITESIGVLSNQSIAEITKTIIDEAPRINKQYLDKYSEDVAKEIINKLTIVSSFGIHGDINNVEIEKKAFDSYRKNIKFTDELRAEIKNLYDKGSNAIYLQWSNDKGVSIEDIKEEMRYQGINFTNSDVAGDMIIDFLNYYNELKEFADMNKGKIATKNKWDDETIDSMTEELRDALSNIIAPLIENNVLADKNASKKVKAKLQKEYEDALNEFKGKEIAKIKAQANSNAELKAARNIEQLNKTIESITRNVERLAKENSIIKTENVIQNRIINNVRVISNGKVDSSIAHDEEFLKSIAGLKSLVNRGNLVKSDIRGKVLQFGEWYREDNPMLENLYDPAIKEAIDNIGANNSLKDSNGNIRYTDKGNIMTNRKPLSLEELRLLDFIVQHTKKLIKDYDTEWKGEQRVKISEEADKANNIALKFKDYFRKNKFVSIFKNFGTAIIEPRTVLRSMFGYQDNPMSEFYNEIANGENKASYITWQLRNEVNQFYKENKGYKKSLKEKVKFQNVEISKAKLLSIYKLFQQQHSRNALVWNGFGFRDKNRYWQSINTIDEKAAKELESLLTETDRKYLDVVAKFFEMGSQYQIETDNKIKGYSTINPESSKYYFPINRKADDRAKSFDESYIDSMNMNAIATMSITKSRIKNMKQIEVYDIDQVLDKYSTQVGKYAGLAIPIKAFQRLYNTNINNNINKPISLRNTLNESVWNNAGKYITSLMADIQGIGRQHNEINMLFGKIRGAYAKYQLGANLKVIMSQMASYPTAFTELRFTSMAKIMTKKIDFKAMDKYCTWAFNRNVGNEPFKSETLIDQWNKITDVFQKPIAMSDRFTIGMIWNACQFEVETNHKGDDSYKFGTEKNMIEAGKLLEQVGRKTQPNYTQTERTALQRTQNELLKTFAMFTAVPSKQLSRLVDAFGELSASVYLSKNGEISQEKMKAAKVKLAKAITAVTIANLVYILMAQLVKHMFDKDREDKDGNEISIGLDMLKDFAATTIGMIPIAKDIYSYIVDGFDINTGSYLTGGITDMIGSTVDIAKQLSEIVNGNVANDTKIASSLKSIAYSIGTLTGIPIRNMYNTLFGLIKRFDSSTAYKMQKLFTSSNYLTKLSETEDANLSKTIINEKLKDRSLSSEKVSSELYNLYKETGDITYPQSISQTITYKNKEYSLTKDQYNQFKATYSKATKDVEELINNSNYDSLTAEQKAKAINNIYDAYYILALNNAIGTNDYVGLLSNVCDVVNYAMIKAYYSTLESDKDKDGNTIAGSKKTKFINYVYGLNMSNAQRCFLISLMGYSLTGIPNKTQTSAESLVKKYIDAQNITTDQKKILYKKCGIN